MDGVSLLLIILSAPLVADMAIGAMISGAPAFQDARVPWLRRPRNRPALYLMRLRADPRVFKVGYTSRRVETRRDEIAVSRGLVRDDVVICGIVRMPHAYAAEQLAHRRLRASRGVRGLGGEWYALTSGRPDRAERIVMGAARATRTVARLRLSWPSGVRLAMFTPR